MSSNTSNKITVIINDINDISKSAIHHADILGSYYNCYIELFFLGNKENLDILKNFSKKVKETQYFLSYEEVVKAIHKENNTTLIVLGLKIDNKKYNKESIEIFNKLLGKLAIPIVTIQYANFNNQYKHIILPLDLTKVTTQKVSKAIELSKLSGGAIINVLSVLFTSDQYDINRLTLQMVDVKSEIEKAGVACTAEIVKASPEDDGLSSVIVDYAHKSNADIIMIMSSSNINLKNSIIDKDGWEIITKSQLPVMNIIPNFN
jgi:nucleotide-binding universal stress UspA family protein